MLFDSLLELIGKNISSHRKLVKITQKEMAEKIGVSYRHLQSIEAGDVNITLATLFRFANFFNLRVCDLVCEPQDSNKI